MSISINQLWRWHEERVLLEKLVQNSRGKNECDVKCVREFDTQRRYVYLYIGISRQCFDQIIIGAGFFYQKKTEASAAPKIKWTIFQMTKRMIELFFFFFKSILRIRWTIVICSLTHRIRFAAESNKMVEWFTTQTYTHVKKLNKITIENINGTRLMRMEWDNFRMYLVFLLRFLFSVSFVIFWIEMHCL